MTPQQMIDSFRLQSDDAVAPYLWSDALVLAYLNEGQVEAARRSRAIEDGTTSAVCQIAVSAGTALYAVDSRVLFIRRAKLASQTLVLPKIHPRDIDLFAPGWDSQPNGDPLVWMPYGTQSVRLHPTPDANTTLHLYVVRDPLADMTTGLTPTLSELPARAHHGLVNYAMHRAYLHRERQDQYRPEESRERLDMFEAEFGKKSSLIDELWINRQHGYDDYEGLR